MLHQLVATLRQAMLPQPRISHLRCRALALRRHLHEPPAAAAIRKWRAYFSAYGANLGQFKSWATRRGERICPRVCSHLIEQSISAAFHPPSLAFRQSAEHSQRDNQSVNLYTRDHQSKMTLSGCDLAGNSLKRKTVPFTPYRPLCCCWRELLGPRHIGMMLQKWRGELQRTKSQRILWIYSL